MAEITFNYAGYGPTIKEKKSKFSKSECEFVEMIDGEWCYVCQNLINEFYICLPPLSKPNKFTFKHLRICKDHLEKLTNKYSINFEEELPIWIHTKYSIEKDFHNTNNQYTNDPNYYNYTNNNFIRSLRDNLSCDDSIDVQVDPEKFWFNSIYALKGLPISWFEDLEYHSSFTKKSSLQGKYNGPDFIFKNTKNSKLIGFEISSWMWNVNNSFKTEKAFKNYAKNNIYCYRSFDEYVIALKEIIKKKSNKKYLETDELYLGIVVSDTIQDYEYYILEVILNKYIKDNNININAVFIL